MGRIPKGVVTVGVTYVQTRADTNEGAWHLDPALSATGGMACPDAGGRGEPLVHQLIDHWIPGFGMAGMLAEAKALVQQAARTGVDPLPALEALVDRFLLTEYAPDDSLAQLIPPDLCSRLPRSAFKDASHLLDRLRRELGEGLLRARLAGRLLEHGWEAMAVARATWYGRGLDFRRRQSLARSLGRVLAWMEHCVGGAGWASAHGELAVASDMVRFRFDPPGVWEWACVVSPAGTARELPAGYPSMAPVTP